MNSLLKYWRVILAVVLAAAAIPVFFVGYLTPLRSFSQERDALDEEIRSLQNAIVENALYADIQDQLEGAETQLEESRRELYQHFPADMLEEDQLLYVQYLEDASGMNAQGDVGYNVDLHDFFLEQYGTNISFSFGTAQPLQILSDGSMLQAVEMTVYFRITYEGFKNMIQYIATDSRIASVHYCTLDYDEANDIASGTLTVLCYTIRSSQVDYQTPDAGSPGTGKDNLFE